jgi:hypothetical protein
MTSITPAFSEVDLYRDYGGQHLELDTQLYKGPWKDIVRQVNLHNDAYVRGDYDYQLRVFCPWGGDELHVPRHSSP